MFDEGSIKTGKIIAQGAFGKVKLAELRSGKEVVLKEIEVGTTLESANEFKEESAIISKMNGSGYAPNIVLIHGLTVENKNLGIVMEKADGNMMAFVNTWDWNTKIDVAFQIVDALQFLHWNNVIHYDLKGPNVLVFHQHGMVIAKLADFGSAKILNVPNFGKSGGTPGYLPLDSGKPSQKSDAYALGHVFYELFYGGGVEIPVLYQKTFGSNWDLGAMTGKLRLKMPDPSNPKEDLLQTLITQCWEVRPEGRPTDPQILNVLREMKK